ncbi:MAG: hypothetical protein WC527_01650 [Candidatus Margulisiibacteriota bacterium]
MPEKFNICTIQPEGYNHSHAFAEVSLLLQSSLMSLSYDCTTSINGFYPDRVNIVLGSNLWAPDPSTLKSIKYIPYQLKQLPTDRKWLIDRLSPILCNAKEIWDYSKENIAFLNELGLKAKYLPIGYHEKLETIEHKADKDIDVLFYGSLNERRKAILDGISGIKTKVLFGVYGRERDEYISRAKIILNVHSFESKILEVVRISYLLNNKCFIVSEESPINPYKKVDLSMFEYKDILESCKHFVENPKKIEEIRDQNYKRFKESYNMIDLLKMVI